MVEENLKTNDAVEQTESKQTSQDSTDSTNTVASAPVTRQKGRSKGKQVYEGAAYITCSFNNTLVTITDARGNTLAWSSSGKCGFKGSKKSTPYAGQMVATDAAKIVTDPKTGCGMERIKVYVKGFGSSRDSAIRAIASLLKVTALIDTTGIPFNGCRNSKERRV